MKDKNDSKWRFFPIQDKFSRRVIIVTLCLFVSLGYSAGTILDFGESEVLSASRLNELVDKLNFIDQKLKVPGMKFVKNQNEISLTNETYPNNCYNNPVILNLLDPSSITVTPASVSVQGTLDQAHILITSAQEGFYDLYAIVEGEKCFNGMGDYCSGNLGELKLKIGDTITYSIGQDFEDYESHSLQVYTKKVYLRSNQFLKIYYEFCDQGSITVSNLEIKLIKVQDI